MDIDYIPRTLGGAIPRDTALPASYAVYRFPQAGVIPGVPGTFTTEQEIIVDLTQSPPAIFWALSSDEAGPYAPNNDGTGQYHHGSN